MKFNIIKIILLLSISFMAMLSSCRKDIDVFLPYETKTTLQPLTIGGNQANPILDSIRLKPIKGKIDCGKGGKIKVNKDVFVRFRPNGCVDSLTGKVCTGIVDVEIIYVIKRGDMIRMNMPTIGEKGKLIGSAGEVFIKVYQNGKPVQKNPNIYDGIQVNIVSPNVNNNMLVFDAQNVGTNDFAWVVNNQVDLQFFVIQDSIGTQNTQPGYSFPCKTFQWVNCDYFYKVNDPKTTVCVQMTDTIYNEKNTAVFAVFKSENIVCPFRYNTAKGQFCSYENSIPIGEKVIIVTMSIKKSATTSAITYVVGTAAATVIKDLVIPITTTKEMSLAEFTAFLDSL